MRIRIEGMVLSSLRGLNNLTDLKALMAEPPLLPFKKSGRTSLIKEAITTKKSSQFHWSLKYENSPEKPIAMTLKTNSVYTNKLKKGSEVEITLLMRVVSSTSV